MTYQIEFSRLPFKAIDNQVIYIESRYDAHVNEYIKANYDALCEEFGAHGLEFCYSPNITLSSSNLELLRYLAPHQVSLPATNIDSSSLLQYLSDKTLCDKIVPSLMILSKKSGNSYGDKVVFNATTISQESLSSPNLRSLIIRNIREAFSYISESRDYHSTRLSISSDMPYSYPAGSADEDIMCSGDCDFEADLAHKKSKRIAINKFFDSLFSKKLFDDKEFEDGALGREVEEPHHVPAELETDEVKQLLIDLRTVVDKLKERGVNSYWIECLINNPGKLSRMIITRDYRIVLPDYNDMEISMTPIVKAIYLLFLRHPEGINYKDLGDYRDELKSIYSGIKGLPLDAKMEQSIVRATNPMDNSINEKVARIREAFVTRFDERLATNYIVQGERGEDKHIPLDREYVEWLI